MSTKFDNCQQCGRDRPTNGFQDERFKVTFQDYSESTCTYEHFRLCPSCWKHLLDAVRAGRVPA